MAAIEPERYIEAIRQPEYTGRNRCAPCTVLNVLIAGAVSLSVAPFSVPLALGTFAVCGAVIYVRGYLVPGTPALTRTYLPERALRWFDKDPSVEAVPETDAFDVETVLRDANAIEACPESTDLCLTAGFRTEWYRALDELDAEATTARLADILGVDADRIALTPHGSAFVVLVDAVQVGQWESRGALVADVAADRVLAERVVDWRDRTVDERSRITHGLRVYLDRCPACGGPASMGPETVESCCSSRDVIATTCRDCEERLFELRTSRMEASR